MQSNRPFVETARKFLELEEISGRELSRRLEAHEGSIAEEGNSVTTIARYLNGEAKLNKSAMERIAAALDILPEAFAEYRLGIARDKLDPKRVGLEKALATLAALEGSEVASESAAELGPTETVDTGATSDQQEPDDGS